MPNLAISSSVLAASFAFGFANFAYAADWPTYRGDAARSGYTAEELPAKLSLAWKYVPLHGPDSAWPRDDRMTFDRAHEVVIADGLLFFGSSADGRLVALDARTGQERWAYFTGAPVRFAPAVWKGRVFAVSDDGYLYCLAAADGTLVEKWLAGPTDELILGNGRMVSRWPARGGPVIRDGVVYYAAGIWQSEGIFLQAIDAQSLRVLWRNDKAGSIYMPQPHGGAMAESGVSAQGYLVATEDQLLVPTGRAVPAAFAREHGRFLYYHLQANGHVGGTRTAVVSNSFYNGGCAFNIATGLLEEKLGAGSIAGMPGGLVVHALGRELRVAKRVEKLLPDRKGVPKKSLGHQPVWSLPDVDGSTTTIVAGNTIVAGGGTKVTAVDAKSRSTTWTSDVDGAPHSLAVADGRLYVSTDLGTIYCFDGAANSSPEEVRPARRTVPLEAQFSDAADEIVRKSGVKEGYCLDLDGGDGSLALALAHRTKLQIYVLCPSAEEVAAARKKLTAAGVYGVRVTVHQGDAKHPRYGKYFADLVVCSQSLANGPLEAPSQPPLSLRPFGGVACTGKVGAMQVFMRGALAKTGSWTHQYADIGNTGCSTDEIVKGELHALWFRDVDLEMPQRHGRGHAPLFHGGRMFVEGIHAIRAVNAYNGRNLWEFSLPGVQKAYNADHLAGTAVTGSNFCLGGSSVYVHDKHRCYRLDAATGKKLGEFAPPAQKDGKPGQWGYIACDGKLLYGSLADTEHRVRFAYVRGDMSEQFGESSTFFVLETETGKLLWRYDAEESIRHNTIAIGSGKVFLIDRAIAAEDKWDGVSKERKLPAVTKVNQPAGQLLAFNAQSGKQLWKQDDAFGTMLAYSQQHDALLMGYQSTRFKLPSEVGGKLAVHRGTSGERLWENTAKHVTRPLINGSTIYAQGGAWDLTTGEDRPFTLERSYGCGQLAGSKHMLLFRSATLGYLDLTRGSGVENFGGIRPGCWINALPVGGLVLVPDASAGCVCSYQNRSWMALSGEDD